MATGIPLRWIGPEIVLTGKHSRASDVYSFGILMAEIFTRGRLPFGDLDDATLVGRLVDGDWEPAADLFSVLRCGIFLCKDRKAGSSWAMPWAML